MKSIDRWVDLSSETYLKAQECFEGLATKLVQMTSQSLDNVQTYGLWSGWTGDEYARKNLDITMTSSGIAAVFGNKAISNLIGDASTIDRRGQPLWGALSRAYAIMVKGSRAVGQMLRRCMSVLVEIGGLKGIGP